MYIIPFSDRLVYNKWDISTMYLLKLITPFFSKMLFLHFCHPSDHMHLPFKFGASNRPLNGGCTYQLLIPQVFQLKIGELKVENSTFSVGGLVYVSGSHKCLNTYYYYYHKKYNDPPPTLLPRPSHTQQSILKTHPRYSDTNRPLLIKWALRWAGRLFWQNFFTDF